MSFRAERGISPLRLRKGARGMRNLPLDVQGGIKGGLDDVGTTQPTPLDSDFRRNDGSFAKVSLRGKIPRSARNDMERTRNDSRGSFVILAQARIHRGWTSVPKAEWDVYPLTLPLWIPAYAGMTVVIYRIHT